MNKNKNPIIQNDIMRYKKNKFASSLALLGLVCGCVYFMVLYAQVKNNDYYYKWSIAFDVIYNLVFLLATFLCSEKVKNYDRSMFYVQIVIGLAQIARIFWLPLGGLNNNAIAFGTFIAMAVALGASGTLIIVSAVLGFIRSKSVEEFKKKLEKGEVSVEETLKQLDEQDAEHAVKMVENAEIDDALHVAKEELKQEKSPKTVQAEELPISGNGEEV